MHVAKACSPSRAARAVAGFEWRRRGRASHGGGLVYQWSDGRRAAPPRTVKTRVAPLAARGVCAARGGALRWRRLSDCGSDASVGRRSGSRGARRGEYGPSGPPPPLQQGARCLLAPPKHVRADATIVRCRARGRGVGFSKAKFSKGVNSQGAATGLYCTVIRSTTLGYQIAIQLYIWREC